jgi:hypothetical protein
MAKRYDATVKQLVEARPEDWLALLGIPLTGPARIVDADLSSITAAADKVILVEGSQPFLVHLEFQTGLDLWLDQRVMFYNVLLRWRHRLPVRSVVFLLSPAAAHARVTGQVSQWFGPSQGLNFQYDLVRVWELDVESLLMGAVGTVPLAPLAVDASKVEDVFHRVDQRLRLAVQTESVDRSVHSQRHPP